MLITILGNQRIPISVNRLIFIHTHIFPSYPADVVIEHVAKDFRKVLSLTKWPLQPKQTWCWIPFRINLRVFLQKHTRANVYSGETLSTIFWHWSRRLEEWKHPSTNYYVGKIDHYLLEGHDSISTLLTLCARHTREMRCTLHLFICDDRSLVKGQNTKLYVFLYYDSLKVSCLDFQNSRHFRWSVQCLSQT